MARKMFNLQKELPQTLLGILVVKITGAKMKIAVKGREIWEHGKDLNGVSLGKKIIVPKSRDETIISHEYGHCLQSEEYGWAYLIIVGIPSIIRNIWDTIAHKKWPKEKRYKWYYGGWPEDDADKRGGVKR